MTLGFDVFVQLVIAAITTAPSSTPPSPDPRTPPSAPAPPPFVTPAGSRPVARSASAALNADAACFSGTRSCGRFGPARLGSIIARSKSITSL